MDVKEMRQLPDEELQKEIDAAREKLFRMRFRGKGKDVENPGALRQLRKDIARMYTILSERRIARAAARRARKGAEEARAAEPRGSSGGGA